MSGLSGGKQYRESVTANDAISKSSSDFAFGGDALQNDFAIPCKKMYKIGVVYQWRHEKKDQQHRTQIRVDGVENTDVRTRQYMGGQDDDTGTRMVSEIWTEVELDVQTYDIDFQWASEDETAYLYARTLYVEEID